MKYEIKKELKKFALYAIFTALVFELYLILGVTIVYGEELKDYKNYMIALPIITGPSIGYGVYRIRKYKERVITDLKFRQYIIIRTTLEATAIALPLYWVTELFQLI